MSEQSRASELFLDQENFTKIKLQELSYGVMNHLEGFLSTYNEWAPEWIEKGVIKPISEVDRKSLLRYLREDLGQIGIIPSKPEEILATNDSQFSMEELKPATLGHTGVGIMMLNESENVKLPYVSFKFGSGYAADIFVFNEVRDKIDFHLLANREAPDEILQVYKNCVNSPYCTPEHLISNVRRVVFTCDLICYTEWDGIAKPLD